MSKAPFDSTPALTSSSDSPAEGGEGRIHAFIVLVALMLALIQTGCKRGHDERTADNRIILNYWEKWTGFEATAMQAVVDDYNASQNRVVVRMLSVSSIDQKLMLATAGGNPPDLAGLWSHTVNVYAEKGALTPLDSMLAEARITRDDYVPVFWELCGHRGFQWALPSTPATLALHWNKDRFREAGLDPDRAPQSLAELDAMAEKLTVVAIDRGGKRERVRFVDLTPAEREAKKFDLIELGFTPTEPGWWNQLWGAWFGGELWDGRTRITCDSADNRAAFEWFQSYPRKYGLENLRRFGSSFGNFQSPQNAFTTGRVAMVLQGVWMQNFILKYSPNLKWAAAPFPSNDPATLPNVTIVETDVLVLPNGSPHPREAFDFIRYVNTQPVMEKLILGQRKISPLTRVSEEFFAKHTNPYIRVFTDLARSRNARFVPRISVWNEYADEMNVAADRMFSLAVTPAGALETVRARVQWKFDRVQRRWDLIKDERLKEWAAR